MADLRYKNLERTLAEIFRVPSEELGSFRGRMRHLRKLRVPDLERVGRGTQLTYTRAHALELVIAIELEQAGIWPRLVVGLAKHAVNVFFENLGSKNVYMFISNSFNFLQAGETMQSLINKLKPGEYIGGFYPNDPISGVYTFTTMVSPKRTSLDRIRQLIGGRVRIELDVSACNSALPATWK